MGRKHSRFSRRREDKIFKFRDREAKSVRKRIRKMKHIDPKKKQEFIERIRKIAHTLQNEENMPLSKTNLAEKYAEEYGESGNTLQKLRRNLKNNGLTFEELLDEVNTKFT